MSGIEVKICGIVSSEVWQYCVKQGVSYLGLMFYDPSPRNLSIIEAKNLCKIPRMNSKSVAVCVDADDEKLAEIAREIQPDYWQFHGQESATRVREVQQTFKIPVIKAFPIADKSDFEPSHTYLEVAEMFMFDAKPRPEDTLPGGNSHAFNWSLMPEQQIARPWFLAGGLKPENVCEALKLSQASRIDISSGVEEERGIKCMTKICKLLQNVRHFDSCRDDGDIL